MSVQYLQSAYCVLTLLYFQPVLMELMFMDEDAEGPTCGAPGGGGGHSAWQWWSLGNTILAPPC